MAAGDGNGVSVSVGSKILYPLLAALGVGGLGIDSYLQRFVVRPEIESKVDVCSEERHDIETRLVTLTEHVDHLETIARKMIDSEEACKFEREQIRGTRGDIVSVLKLYGGNLTALVEKIDQRCGPKEVP